MNDSFGQSVLSLYTLIEGKTLSYGYSNSEMTKEVSDFQNLFRSMLVSHIENHDELSRGFLELCVDHIQDISNEKFNFLSNKCCKCGKSAKFYNEYRYTDKYHDRIYYCADCAIEQSYCEGKIDDGHIIKYCSRCGASLINGCYILCSDYCCADCFVTGLGYNME